MNPCVTAQRCRNGQTRPAAEGPPDRAYQAVHGGHAPHDTGSATTNCEGSEYTYGEPIGA